VLGIGICPQCLGYRILEILVVRPFRVVRHEAKASHYILNREKIESTQFDRIPLP